MGKSFSDYMNQNNLWIILDNSELVEGMMWLDINDLLEIFGRGLTNGEKHFIIHGTTADIDTVSLFYAKDRKDFGKVFYTTTDINQAIKLAKTLRQKEYMRGNVYAKAHVYSFKVSLSGINSLKIHRFDKGSIAWIDYIIKNRVGGGTSQDYDIVIGHKYASIDK